MAERRYSFRFSLPEGCILFASFLLASFLVFLFGVYVGKEVEARKIVEQSRTVRLPVSALENQTPVHPPATPSLLWKLPTEKPAVSPVPPPQPSAPVSESSTAESTITAAPSIGSSSAAEVSPREPSLSTIGKKSEGTSVRWSVQVQATRQEDVARNLAKLLREQGHTSTVSKVVRQGERWYRVRVGSFSTEEEARALVSRFRREGKFVHAYPVSE
jgi:cell division septation protein DedD